jgi:undecaprenyl-diphosphatase
MANIVIIISANYLFLVNILIASIYFFSIKISRKKQLIKLALPTFILTFIFAKLSSMFINDPRPFVQTHIQPLIPHVADNGFPSDHTLLTMSLASIIFVHNKKLGIVLFIIAVIIGIARVLAAIHHPVDIIGATIIAAGTTFLVLGIENFTKNRKHFTKD